MKPCEYCLQLSLIRYRIQFDASKSWVLVCPSCWQKLSSHNLHYRYGGTWKAKNKKAALSTAFLFLILF